jgi:hypothetical protein
MKKHDLKSIIKEEIKKILNEENETDATVDPEQESFLKQLNNLRAELIQNQKGLNPQEKQNLMDLFTYILEFARTGNLTQQLEDRIKKILTPAKKLNEFEETTPQTTVSSLARGLRNTSLDLAKNPSGIQNTEAEGIERLIRQLIMISREGTLTPSMIDRVNTILTPSDKI